MNITLDQCGGIAAVAHSVLMHTTALGNDVLGPSSRLPSQLTSAVQLELTLLDGTRGGWDVM